MSEEIIDSVERYISDVGGRVSPMSVSNTDQDYTALPVASQILYEDNHIIVINKLPSQIVQGDKTGDRPLSELVAGIFAASLE